MFLIVWSIAPRVPAKCPNLLSASRLIISAAQIITTTASRTIQFDAGLSNQSTQSFQISIMVVPLSSMLRVYITHAENDSPRQSGLPCEQRRSRQMIEWLAQSAPRRDGPRYSCGATMAAISFWRSASSAPAFTRARLVGEYAASRPRPSRCLGATSVQSRPPPNPKIATLVLGHAAWGVTEPRASARRELFM